MRFYGYYRSSAAYRCRIAFNLKGVTPQFVPVHLRKGEQRSADYLATNPQGLIPALETDGATITQSLAIIEWLEETRPTPPLLPKDALERAHVRALALSIACDIHPLQNLRVLAFLASDMGLDEPALGRWRRRWIGEGLAAYETMLARSGRAGAFSFGDTPTLADVCLMPQLFSADRFGVDVGAHAHLQRIRKSCQSHPAFAAAHPDRQPDAE